MKKLILLFCALAMTFSARAQERTVTGTVTDQENGEPLPGVNVVLKGTATGTVTDVDGNYSIQAPEEGGTLTFSFIGLQTREVQIGNRSVIDIALSSDVRQLNEVVVTALGITRAERSLGYAVQQVDGEEISETKETNVVNALSGKVSGVSIKQSNSMGGSANILIRGINSLTGNNQPLFVVDGVPINNTTPTSAYQDEGQGGYDYGNFATDINPQDVESVSVLKGASAAALYGSRAANGVILITTKKGGQRDGIGITLNSSVIASSVNPATVPEHQRQYGAGYGPYYGSTGYFFDEDVDGDGVDDLVAVTSEDASWGAEFDPELMVVHWDAMDLLADNYGEKRPWVAPEHGLMDFFETGVMYNNNIAFEGGNDQTTFRLSYSNVEQTGILPNSKISTNAVSFNGSHSLTDKLTASANINFSYSDALGRAGTGYDSRNVFQGFGQWFQANLDFERLKNYRMVDGTHNTWNKVYYDDPTPAYFNNPYWERYENFQTDNRTRVFGNIKLEYAFNEWLNASYRLSTDFYDDLQEERYAVGSVANRFYDMNNTNYEEVTSNYTKRVRSFREDNHELLLTLNGDISPAFSLSGLIGGNLRQMNRTYTMNSTREGLIVAELYSSSNSLSASIEQEDRLYQLEQRSVFGQLTIGFRDQLFLDMTARNDWSSTLPEGNNSYFYPSASLSWVFSELPAFVNSPWFSFGKIRVNWAEVGNDTSPYNVDNYYVFDPNFGSAPNISVDDYLNNPELLPEIQRSIEAGIDVRFINNRIGLDVALYQTNTFNQILPVRVSYASGYAFKYINAGEIQNKGVEVALNAVPLRINDFDWHLRLNWTRNQNEVLELSEDVDNYLLGDRFFVSVNAAEGEPYGTIKGTDYVYHENGGRIVGPDGMYLSSESTQEVLGTYLPDWNMGVTNTFTWKGFNLSALIDIQQGGSIYSESTAFGRSTGLYSETAGLNAKGNPKRDPVSEGGGILYEGVLEDGTPNEKYIEANEWGTAYDYNVLPAAHFVFDASYIKLREVTLTYNFPQSLIENTPFTTLSLGLVGRNLAIISDNVKHFDPEAGLSAGNVQGMESGALPTPRSYGVNLKVGF